MAYAVRCHLVTAKDRQGDIKYYYAGMNPIIPWLSDDQAEHLLNLGLIELLDGVDIGGDEAETADAVARINECLAAMDALGLARDCGSTAAREALRANGHQFRNSTISAAVKARKTIPALSAPGA
jgi:hypothetical protein